ncbi:MAG: biosynthetic-type acetolactate synthase large subunit [Polyangiaceae bacterium]|nr:biosynthetic-type acetolactate synthase large subunit [Polyangiaceae bacterium]MCW5789757.1 biosynthetic-type acetolactate synthase large subunit [Polyangiaceae bacterium]
MRGAKIVVESLLEEGVDVLFGYPGGAILHVYDELHQAAGRLRHVLVRHEQGAIHAAEGYAKSTGKVGVCLVTSGPGATNIITGLANAMMDSTPLVVITGQVPTNLIGNDAFQEADIVGITRPCTKYNYLVRDVAELAATIKEAFYLAKSGRPGPVLIDLPKDVTAMEHPFVYPESVEIPSYRPTIKGHPMQVKRAVDLLQETERCVLYIGGGVVSAGAEPEVAQLAERLNLPVTPTLMGLGAFPYDDDRCLGMLGMHGTYTANMAMAESELILNIGARFDDRVTGRVDRFARKAKIIHVDIDPTSLNKSVRCDVPIVGDAKTVATQLLAELDQRAARAPERHGWWQQLLDWRARFPLRYRDRQESIMPQRLMQELADITQGEDIVSTDVGQHQMWAAQYYPAKSGRLWLTSGGLGTMGYGLPAAIGAAIGNPERRVTCVTGDGSIQMCIQELATAVHEGANVKIVIFNNNYLGMVRQWQALFYSRRYSEVGMKYFPDFVKLAEAYGATGLRAEHPSELRSVLERGLATPGVVIMDIIVEKEANVYPMIPAGAAHYEIVLEPEEDQDHSPRELA